MRRVLATVLLTLFFVSLQAAPRPNVPGSTKAPEQATQTTNKPVQKKHWYQVGVASWYGRAFHGKETASGETYNMFQLTAAHRTLPLGTWLRVTNLDNGRTVVVLVNDRGPTPKSRVIDLSYEAAALLGMKPKGLQEVRLDIVPAPPVVASAQNATENGR